MLNIGGANKKQVVGLAVTPNLGLEVCVYDKNSGEVVKYGQRFLEYNIASREIQDMGAFMSSVTDLFSELDISKENSNVFLVLPNVHFGFRSFDDEDIDDETITSTISADTAESYIFKQEEPIFAYHDMNEKTGTSSKYIAYSSLQRRVVDSIQDACMDLGINLAGVESAITAIPRGVGVTEACKVMVDNNINWDILVINPNNYAIFQMSGSRMLDYVEIPFAIMSFEGDEVYQALASAISQYLPNYPAKKLVIVSQTDNVSAAVLKNEIIFDEEIYVVDSNKFGVRPIVSVNDEVSPQVAANMSLSVLGAANPKFGSFATLNVFGDMNYDGVTNYGSIKIKDHVIDISSETVPKASLIVTGILAVIALVVIGAFTFLTITFDTKAKSAQKQIDQLNSEIESIKSKMTKSIGPIIKEISDNNKLALNFYDSLAQDIPTELWLSYYINKNGKEVGIEGYSVKIDDIYEYYKSLKILAPQSEIKLNKLEVFTEEVVKKPDGKDQDKVVMIEANNLPQTFSFEISNTTYTKTFNAEGNTVTGGTGTSQSAPAATTAPAAAPAPAPDEKSGGTASFAAKINEAASSVPEVPDVEINLKEIK